MLPGTPHLILFTFIPVSFSNTEGHTVSRVTLTHKSLPVFMLRLAVMAAALGAQARRRTVFYRNII